MEKSREMLRAGGASLSDERSEEMTNREGVAAGGATKFIFDTYKNSQILDFLQLDCYLRNILNFLTISKIS